MFAIEAFGDDSPIITSRCTVVVGHFGFTQNGDLMLPFKENFYQVNLNAIIFMSNKPRMRRQICCCNFCPTNGFPFYSWSILFADSRPQAPCCQVGQDPKLGFRVKARPPPLNTTPSFLCFPSAFPRSSSSSYTSSYLFQLDCLRRSHIRN
jgi:hypothetical protein